MSKKHKDHHREPEGAVAVIDEHPQEPEKAKGKGEATPSGGAPRDVVQYLEAKLILKPDRFTSVESFREFGKLVKRTAKALKVGFTDDPTAGRRPDVREIIFADTPDCRLYNNAFILRRRITYVDGFPVGDPEIVFKFRHPDLEKAAAIDVRPRIVGKYRIKFKAEALPPKDHLGGFRILYSHNCQFNLSQAYEGDRRSMGTLTHVFPALAAVKKSDQEQVNLVSGAIVEEVLLHLGELDFGKGIVAKNDVALWRTRGEHMPLVGEWAFQFKFDNQDQVHQKAREQVMKFYVALQHDVENWISLGTTKTGMVYRLKGNAPQGHE